MTRKMDLIKEIPLFTLKGPVAVLFLDGETVEGEYIAQDAYNIFLSINDEPVMISRVQIRLIKGLQGQPVETDSVPASLAQESAGSPKSQIDLFEGIQRETVPTDPLTSSMEHTKINLPEQDLPVPPPLPIPQHELVEGESDNNDVTVLLGSKGHSDKANIEIQKRTSASLTCINGPHAGEIFHLKEGATTIGRASDNVIVLSEDKEISHHHAIVLEESGKYVVRDKNSLNGTFVNGELVVGSHHLESGDEILVGLSALKYELAKPSNEDVTRIVSRPIKWNAS